MRIKSTYTTRYSLMSALLVLAACGDNKAPVENDEMVTLAPSKSISILSVFSSSSSNETVGLTSMWADWIKTVNPDVVAVHNASWQGAGTADFLTSVAYHCGKTGDRRQPLFARVDQQEGVTYGEGFLFRDCFDGTSRVELHSGLIMLMAKLTLPSGDLITLASCHFDTSSDASIRLLQAQSLNEYVASHKGHLVVMATLMEDEDGATVKELEKKFRRSCKYTTEKNYPAANPQHRFEYILTPLAQRWGTQGIVFTGSDAISSHKGLYIRIGLR